jgi:hypothetical protein
VTDEQWDAIKDRLWDKYETVGYQGERFMSNDDFDTALDVARQELASTALAQPEPEGPTASDVTELFYRHMGEGSEVGFENAIAEALTRWGRPTIKPVPVAERPWEREGWCDAEGRCWWGRVEGNPGNPEWFLAGLSEIEGFYEIGDWIVLLPHHALPVPGAERLPVPEGYSEGPLSEFSDGGMPLG